MAKRALIVIDIQNDYFSGGQWPLHNMEASAEKAVQVLEYSRQKGDLVVHVCHENGPNDAFFVPGTSGVEIHTSVRPIGGEHTLAKHHINAFLETDLKAHLDSHQIQEVTLVGSMSHLCIAAAARAAADFGYTVTVVHDACATHLLQFNEVVVAPEAVQAANMYAIDFGYGQVKSAEEYTRDS
ncbi:isochorismatase family protein [Vibrio sp. SM6]|uniref:Isochorismatase family protein n=2 Tax=Vibrio agarilyticus TaxID=2726741 RepID=A0A7X8YHC6_9VIBR|nr:isochorismatase family protein [Vibrio agarilyticus]